LCGSFLDRADEALLQCTFDCANLVRRALRGTRESPSMKVRASVKARCEKCKIIRRHGNVMVICANPKHKQKQG